MATKTKQSKKQTQVAKAQPQTQAAQRFAEISERLNEFEDTFVRLAPAMGVPSVRVIATVQNSLRGNPQLLQCTAASIIGSALQCAVLGIEPDGILGFAHLIPFWNKKRGVHEAQVVIGYRGFISLALRSGHVLAVTPRLVKANDLVFDYDEGDQGYIKHKRALKDRGEVVAGYCLAQLPNSDRDKFVVMDYDELHAVKSKWGARNDVWKTHPEAMWEKTLVRKLCKTLGFTAEGKSKGLARAVQLDEAAESALPQDHLLGRGKDALPTPDELAEYAEGDA